jgi:hypothetical protein
VHETHAVITDLDTSKREHTESLLLLRRHLGNWSRGPAVSMRSELLVAHVKCGHCMLCPCRVRKKFLSTFETAPFLSCTRTTEIAPPLLMNKTAINIFSSREM